MNVAILARFASPLVWRRPRGMAKKLAEFSATEAGSALDMLRASELAGDPRLRRLFLRHALDEARHARRFAQAADRLDPRARAALSERAAIHARRQDLYQRLGAEAFLAFVHRAERAGEAHFRALIIRLEASDPELAELFSEVAKDERFHVAYSGRWLGRLAGPARRARIRREALLAAWAAWRRAGRRLGERAAWLLGCAVYFLALPPFAILQRLLDPERPGWRPGRRLPASIDQARRQF
jgi:rubrerythrin